MSEEFECTVDGLDDLERMLESLAPQQAKSAMRSAGRKAATIWQDAVEANAPRASGFLADNIIIKTHASGSDDGDSTGAITIEVGPSKQAFYAMFQEFGTIHQPAQPFVGPAYEDNKDEVLSTFETELRNTLERLQGK